MRFVFPQNYKMKSKIFGLIDYQTAIIDIIWAVIVYFIINLFFHNLNIKIFLFITLFFPVLIFSILGINGESIINVVLYMTKYITKPKIMYYDKK